jgi:hypothetical protein
VVEYLPRKCEVLTSNSRDAKKKKRKKKKEKKIKNPVEISGLIF